MVRASDARETRDAAAHAMVVDGPSPYTSRALVRMRRENAGA